MSITKASTRGPRASGTRTSLALALAIALCGSSASIASAADAAGANAFATVAHPTALRGGDALMGALPLSQPIHVEVALKLRNKDALDALIEANTYKQMHHQLPQLLTSDQFLANHAPTQVQAQSVADYLKSKGYTNVTIAPNRLLVSADGTAQTARDAFMTSFAQVKTNDGRIAYANTDAVRIPAALSDRVLAVVGLQDVHIAHSDAQSMRSAAQPVHTAGQSTIVMTHDPLDFNAIYQNDPTFPVVPVGIVSSSSVSNTGGLNQTISDLDRFAATHVQLSPPQFEIVNVNGTTAVGGVDPTLNLASQVIAGMTLAYNKIIFYNIPSPSTANLTADLNRIVVLDETKIIEDSFGVCETDAQADGSAAAQDAILQVAVAQGQTFAVSTGSPDGADQCDNRTNTPRWPASSQYVVAVGGTLLSASTQAWGSEQVYNASGGSPSTFEPMPSWQSAFGVTGSGRVAIDVAFDAHPASGAQIVVNGAIVPLGSNALAASLFAASWASVLGARGTTIGFAAPVLYALPATDFHDITSGNNSGGRAGLGFAAGPGYDDASGRGSMIVRNIIADTAGLGTPPVANFTSVSSGATVNFTDTSTHGFWPIVTYAWNFGDGGTSTATSPSHTYATSGVFTVSEKVTDSSGASSTRKESIADGPLQLIQNGDFETGTATPWRVIPASVLTNDASAAHSGSWYAAFGAFINTSEQVSQVVTLPHGLTTATLSFYLNVPTQKVDVNNFLRVYVIDLTPPQGNYQLAIFNYKATAGYVQQSYDLSRFIGHEVRVVFQSHNDQYVQTFWSVDDVSLNLQ